MNRLEFQQLAEVRVREAEALLAVGLWDGAYYLAGYAVECALKACILRLVEQTAKHREALDEEAARARATMEASFADRQANLDAAVRGRESDVEHREAQLSDQLAKLEIVDEVPRNPMGKIRKQELRDRYAH